MLDRHKASAVSDKRSSAGKNKHARSPLSGWHPVMQLQRTVGNRAVGQMLRRTPSSEPPGRSNPTGMPDELLHGIEQLSGFKMDDVRVHRNSDKPAELDAHAYAQGTDIHVAPGQERHLPHEAWHIVQQKQGRVEPTHTEGETAINDADALESEADRMGEQASSYSPREGEARPLSAAPAFTAARLPAQLLRISNVQIRPYGKTGETLWNHVKTAMFNKELSPHGAKSVFINEVKADTTFANVNAFTEAFVNEGIKEAERVKMAKLAKQPAKGWTRYLSLNRPAWPDDYKEAVIKGEDIRHIVRNATLKNALEAELLYLKQKHPNNPEKITEAFKHIATSIGLSENFEHAWGYVDSVYRTLYLNKGNLFAGPGAVNRIIGLTADKIIAAGEKAKAMKVGLTKEYVKDAFTDVLKLIDDCADKQEEQAGRMNDAIAETFLENVANFRDTITTYIFNARDALLNRFAQGGGGMQTEPPSPQDLGKEIVDIGNNFCFDIPLLPASHVEEAKKAMPILIKAENFLSAYSGGNTGELIHVLKDFLLLPDLLSLDGKSD